MCTRGVRHRVHYWSSYLQDSICPDPSPVSSRGDFFTVKSTLSFSFLLDRSVSGPFPPSVKVRDPTLPVHVGTPLTLCRLQSTFSPSFPVLKSFPLLTRSNTPGVPGPTCPPRTPGRTHLRSIQSGPSGTPSPTPVEHLSDLPGAPGSIHQYYPV